MSFNTLICFNRINFVNNLLILYTVSAICVTSILIVIKRAKLNHEFAAAHTIGTTACFFMTDRLYNFSPGGGSDPSIHPSFLPVLMASCPRNGDVNARLPMDRGSSGEFDDNILQNVRSGFAVLRSDASLYEDVETRNIVDSYFGIFSPFFGTSFEDDFANAMVKMGRIDVLTGLKGRIRRQCSTF